MYMYMYIAWSLWRLLIGGSVCDNLIAKGGGVEEEEEEEEEEGKD